MYFMPINGRGGGQGAGANKTHTVSMETLSFDSKTWWEAAVETEKGVSGFILRERWRRAGR